MSSFWIDPAFTRRAARAAGEEGRFAEPVNTKNIGLDRTDPILGIGGHGGDDGIEGGILEAGGGGLLELIEALAIGLTDGGAIVPDKWPVVLMGERGFEGDGEAEPGAEPGATGGERSFERSFRIEPVQEEFEAGDGAV